MCFCVYLWQKMVGALQPATHTGLTVPLADVQLSHRPENNCHRPKLAPEDSPFQDIQVEEDHFFVLHLPNLLLFLSFLQCLSLTDI
jgi:hypothetical protein